jgi:hypothetical protein
MRSPSCLCHCPFHVARLCPILLGALLGSGVSVYAALSVRVSAPSLAPTAPTHTRTPSNPTQLTQALINTRAFKLSETENILLPVVDLHNYADHGTASATWAFDERGAYIRALRDIRKGEEVRQSDWRKYVLASGLPNLGDVAPASCRCLRWRAGKRSRCAAPPSRLAALCRPCRCVRRWLLGVAAAGVASLLLLHVST